MLQISNFLDTIKRYSVIETTTIEGMDVLGAKLRVVVNTIMMKPNDVCDFR